ncbi:LASP1 protein, partial [Rhynochetos jubatus]|nr:LASP1 protein [Rhynochetos jubatus]
QFWHKACFHCETCKMTLNMKNYKGYEKKPYCNAHYPKQSFTMVADTPENLRLKQQSELQSQIRYKEEFEKNKGKGFSVVADTPELQRIKKTQDQISNVSNLESLRLRLPPVAALSPAQQVRLCSQGCSWDSNGGVPSTAAPTRVRTPPPPQQRTPPSSQSYSYKEPAAPASTQRNAPSGGGKRFRAVYDYNAADEDEVSFQDGDTIINVQQIDDGWMYGTVERTGDTGMLPANYVEAI